MIFNLGWPTLINKGLSLAIAIGYLIFFDPEHSGGYLKGGLCLLLVLSFIWFGDELGSLTGNLGRGGRVDVETPGWMVCSMGWFFLIGLPIVIYFVNKQ